MLKKFRAWDGEKYWYADKNLVFLNNYDALNLLDSPFELKDLEMAISKVDLNSIMIYENDLIVNEQQDPTKIFQVVWSNTACGFRKVVYGQSSLKTRIDEAFMNIIGTIHSHKY